jgi:superfamily II DNA or RNA helicase
MKWVANTIKDISSSGNTLILVDRISAGEILQEQLEDSVFVSGSTKNVDRKEQYDEVSTATNKIIIATYGVASVGINIPRIFNLVLIEPGKSFVRVIQSIGRGIRKAEDKDYLQVIDVTSNLKYSKRHLTKRKAFYKEQSFKFQVTKVEYK